MFFDPLYLLFMLPGMLLAGWAQMRVRSSYEEGSKIRSSSGVTGAQAAQEVMRASGVGGVAIKPVQGFLSDHYNPTEKVLALSPGVYGSPSLSALGIAAHEAGHALQDAYRYGPLALRNFLVPAASLGSNAAWFVMIGGLILRSSGLLYVGIGLFSAVVLFQLVNLPVEFDASRRARAELLRTGLITQAEDPVVAKVLNAAALTYVAATLSSVLTLVYFLLRSGLLGGRGSDE